MPCSAPYSRADAPAHASRPIPQRAASLLWLLPLCWTLAACIAEPAPTIAGSTPPKASSRAESSAPMHAPTLPSRGGATAAAKPAPGKSRPQPAVVDGARPTRCAAAPSGMLGATRLNGETASDLGHGSTDLINGVEIARDCSLLLVGRSSVAAGSAAPAPLVAGVAGNTGVLTELMYEGRALRRQRSFGNVINDIGIGTQDEIALAGDAGLLRLSADLHTVRWSKTTLGAAKRVAVAADGGVAALFGKTLRVFDAQGNERFNRAFGDAEVNDVAIDANGVYVTGFAQRDGGPCSQLQVAWVRAYGFDNVQRWRAWDWTHAEAAAGNSSCADTRGMRIAFGRDGGLYFAGESAGGNTIYRYQSDNLATSANNVKTDQFNDAYNTASNHISYVAQLDTANGRVLKGSLLLSRLGDGKGNTIRPRAVSADEQGRVYVAGVSACCIQQRSALSYRGATMAAYAGGDPFVLVLSPDLRTRQLWFSAANGGKGEALGVSASRGLAVLGSRSDAAPMLSDRAMQSARPATATTGGHVLAWSVFAP